MDAQVAHLSASLELFEAITTSIEAARGLSLDDTALAAGRAVALDAYAAADGSTAVFSNTTVQSNVAMAFVNNGGVSIEGRGKGSKVVETEDNMHTVATGAGV